MQTANTLPGGRVLAIRTEGQFFHFRNRTQSAAQSDERTVPSSYIGSHTGPGTVALFFWGDKRGR